MAVITGQANYLSSPAAVPDGGQVTTSQRFGKFAEQYMLNMVPTKHMAALAGQYYSISAASTALVTSLTALTEASPALIIENTSNSTPVNIMLDYVRIYSSAVAAAGTDMQAAWKLDNLRGKWGSAGTAVTPQNANMGAANGSQGTVHVGALVVATAQQSSANARTIYNAFLKPTSTAPTQIIGDTFDFRFGALEAPLPTVLSNVASAGANTFPLGLCIPLAPVILTPGTTATLFIWGSNNGSAPSIMLSGGWYEY